MSEPPSIEGGAKAWQGARRVLCVRLDGLGELLMTTPALRALRESSPARRLTLLCAPRVAAAATAVPVIDEVLAYAAPWTAAAAEGPQDDRRIVQSLAMQEFDAAVIFTACGQSPLPAALLCRQAGIPRVLAYCRENPYQLLSDWRLEREPPHRGETERQLALVATVGARGADRRPSFTVDPSAREQLRSRLARSGLDPDAPWVLIHPGASATARHYPAEHYAELAARIVGQLGCPAVFGGGADEVELIDRIQAALRVDTCSLAGRLGIAETAAAIEAAQVLVADDSGAVQLAAAVGTPVVDLDALTEPQPMPSTLAHQRPARELPGRDRLLRIEPQRVADAVADLCARFPRPAAAQAEARAA